MDGYFIFHSSLDEKNLLFYNNFFGVNRHLKQLNYPFIIHSLSLFLYIIYIGIFSVPAFS